MSQASANPFNPLTIRTADGARLEVLPYGAHILSWTPAGERESRLFTSQASEFRDGMPVRGGVPIIFPQFSGHGPLPKHGFARIQMWNLLQRNDPEGTLRFQLCESPKSLALWPHPFELELEIRLGERQLNMELIARNTGNDTFEFTTALHTYFQVGDIHSVALRGLQGLQYLDAVRDRAHYLEEGDVLRFGEWTDRIYFDAPQEVVLEEPGRRVRIRQEGFIDNVVWNPAVTASAAIPDLLPQDWHQLLCVEAATTLAPIRLEPGQRWRGAQILVAE